MSHPPAPPSHIRVQPPPRLLVGASLLFWGAMTGRPFIGLLFALLVESPHWLRWRWEFDDASLSRTWQMITVLTALVMVLILLEGERATAMPTLVTWLPALLIPMQLAQAYGLRDAIPLSSFSFFAKRRIEHNRRFGIEEPEVFLNFGNVFFAVTLVSATLGRGAEARTFLPGLVILCAWRFLAIPRRRTAAIFALFLAAGGAAVLGQAALNRAYDWVTQMGGGSHWMPDATHTVTAIGSMHDVKLSDEILWRIRTTEGQRAPRLIRRAAFNQFEGVAWRIGRTRDHTGTRTAFSDLDSVEPVIGESYYLPNPRLTSDQAISPDLPRFDMRGSARAGAAMPLPGDVASITGFELDGIERNPLGTVRVFPSKPVLHGLVLWGGGESPDGPPIDHIDTRVPEAEANALHAALAEADIFPGMPTRDILARLGAWFASEFNYTLYLSMDAPRSHWSGEAPISRFLETTRRGHCEYFATAAALILREAGVPTRYCTGYAVIERDTRRSEFVVRGIHGHAWCRVWIAEENRWVDFDPTPPDWLALETRAGLPLNRRIQDAFKRAREDLFIWRSEPRNRIILAAIISLPGIILALVVGRRLWRSRRRLSGGGRPARRADTTPLWLVEPAARRHLGPRPPGTPFAHWLLALPESATLAAAADADLIEAVRLHQRLRYDPAARHDPDDLAARRRLDELARTLRRKLRQRA